MSCSQNWWILGSGILMVLGLSGHVMWTFFRYCELIAKLEGRQQEWAKIHSDESGLNEFKKEQWSKLSEKPYLRFSDPELIRIGNRLQYMIPIMMIASVAIVVATVISNQIFCE